MKERIVMNKTILTYGTFDVFHVGHLNLLQRLGALGSRLIVGVSTDEFNAVKGKYSLIPFEERARIVEAIQDVDLVIPERTWNQKTSDIRVHDVDVFAMGDDWTGKFDALSDLCEVLYLPRTPGISSSEIRDEIHRSQTGGVIGTRDAARAPLDHALIASR